MSGPTKTLRPDAVPVDDAERLEALEKTGLPDSPAEICFDRLTDLAADALYAPVALVSLVDNRRQFFKSARGLPEPWASMRQTPLSHSFCQHVVNSGTPLVVADAPENPVVCDNLAIRDLGVKAYLGVPLRTPDGHVLGAFCAIDGVAREWTERDRRIMEALADLVMVEIASRYRTQQLIGQHQQISTYEAALREIRGRLEKLEHDVTDSPDSEAAWARQIHALLQLVQNT